jgi:hypothetical protein
MGQKLFTHFLLSPVCLPIPSPRRMGQKLFSQFLLSPVCLPIPSPRRKRGGSRWGPCGLPRSPRHSERHFSQTIGETQHLGPSRLSLSPTPKLDTLHPHRISVRL